MKQNKTVHLSVDDTIWLFWELTENNYKSAFEQPVLRFFKQLNEKYEFTVTFYCIMEREWLSLKNITDRYRDEFERNNKWCKFGFHAYNEQRTYATDEYNSVKDDYNDVIRELRRIVGNSLDHLCRIHCYSMQKRTLKAFRKSGLKAILAPEDGAEFDLGLSQGKMMKIKQNGIYKGIFDRTTYISTDLRFERCERKELYDISGKEHLELFTHEWLLTDGKIQEKIIECSEILKQLGYVGGFYTKI